MQDETIYQSSLMELAARRVAGLEVSEGLRAGR
jgi:hypothetical protein